MSPPPTLSPVTAPESGGTLSLVEVCPSEVIGVTIDELTREALALDPRGRAQLAHKLLDSLDELSEAEVEEIWLEESERRLGEVISGSVETVSAEEALARARVRR